MPEARPHPLPRTRSRRRPHRLLVALPPLVTGAGVPYANGLTAHVAGMPFLLAWIVGGVLATSLVAAIAGAVDDHLDREDGGRA